MTLSLRRAPAASPRRAATFRSLDALTLLRPASACGADELEARLDARQRNSDAARAAAASPPTARALRVGFLGELERGGESA